MFQIVKTGLNDFLVVWIILLYKDIIIRIITLYTLFVAICFLSLSHGGKTHNTIAQSD